MDIYVKIFSSGTIRWRTTLPVHTAMTGVMKGIGMDEIELAEYNSREAAAFGLEGLTQARNKAHQLLMLLLGGGAALAAFGLDLLEGEPLQAVAALAVSVAWFCLAMDVSVRGLRSAPVRSWASTVVLTKHQEWLKYNDELLAEGQSPVDPVRAQRRQLVDLRVEAIEGYREASTRAHAAIDRAYLGAALSPLWAAFAACLGWAWLR